MPQIAANLGLLFGEYPLINRVAAAAAAGFRAIEFQFPYSVSPTAMRAEIEHHGLNVLGLNTGLGHEGEFGLGAVAGREQAFAVQFKEALDYALVIGARQIHCLSGVVPPEQRPVAEAVFVTNIRRSAALAAGSDITVLIEAINLRDQPNYFLNSVEHAAAIIDQVGHSNVKIQFDCYHTQIMGGDLIKRFERLQPLIGHVQIAGVPTRNEPNIGEVNYPEFLAAIERLGYHGFVAAEYRPAGRTEDGLGWALPYGVQPR